MLSEISKLAKGRIAVNVSTLKWFFLGMCHQMTVKLRNPMNYLITFSDSMIVFMEALKYFILEL